MINVLLRTEGIIVCFIEIGNIGKLLALRKSDTFDIKPRVETSIVKLANVLSVIHTVTAHFVTHSRSLHTSSLI